MTCLSQQYFERFNSLDSLLERVPSKYHLYVGTRTHKPTGLREVIVLFEQRHKVRGKQTRKPYAEIIFYKSAGWDSL
jgi:hypothetical protein